MDDAFRFVVFTLDERRYALALGCVERVVPMVELLRLPQAPDIVLGLFNLHGRAMPVLDVRARFGHSPRSYDSSCQLLVARAGERVVALAVDHVAGLVDVEHQAITPAVTLLPGLGQVTGVACLDDGLVLIHDLGAFLSLDEDRQLAGAIEGTQT